MIGESIGRYKITAKLGEGGMGEVYLATDTSLDRSVALKFLPAALQKDPEARERLLREAKAVSKLNHKNVLTIHSVESVDGRDFLVMEYVDGRTLKDLLDSGDDIPMDQILRIGLQICDGLASAHEQGIVHRDIKPANIMVTPKGQVKIADFGLATWRGAGQLTKEGSTVGTAAYMSPEQVQGGTVDVRSDIFSAGVVLYELITRNLPFKGDHDAAFAYSILNEAPEPLARYKSNVHPGLQQVIDRALDKDQSTRYPNASAMLADLKRVRKEIEGSNPSGQSRVQSRVVAAQPKKSYMKPVLAGSAVVIIALVILLLKPFKFEVAPEQQAAATDNSLAVLYFDNVADPSDSDKLGQMITSLLITGLSESQYLQVTSRQRLYDILSQLGKGDARSVDRTTASQVATKAGVRWMVTGEILQATPRIVLTAEVSEVGTGKLVTTQKISSEPGEDVFAVADRLGSAIRGNLALPTQAKAERTKSLAEVTTRSPEAYRYYTEGVDYNLRYYAKEALRSFEKAIEYDSTFAMVYYQMANAAGISGDIQNSQRLAWIAQAERYADHASEKERLYIKSSGHFMRGELGLALDDLNTLLKRWPNEVEAHWSKIFICRAAGRDYECIAAAERVIQINPQFADAYNQLAYTYLRVGNRERSQWAIDRYSELTPGDANQYDSRADLYAYVGDAENAKAQYRRALQINPGFGDDAKLAFMYLVTGDDARADSIFQSLANSADPSARAKGRAHLHIVDAYHGRFDQAASTLDGAIATDSREGYEGNWYLSKLTSRMEIHVINREWDQAISLATKIAERNEQEFPTVPDMFRLGLAVIMHWGGDTGRARGVFDDLRSEILALKDTTGWTTSLDKIAAYDALLFKNDPRSACAAFGRTYPFDREAIDAYHFGKAYLEMGDAENAVNTLERDLTYLREEAFYSPYFSVRSHYVLGLAYERSGQKDKAATQYKKFLDIWKDADPGIPEIDDARKRLAALSS